MELFIGWLLCSILGAAILSRYNKAGTGFLLGLILGPIGLIFALVIRGGENKKEDQKRHDEKIQALTNLKNSEDDAKPKRECPYCAETILAKAKVCKHCSKELQSIEA